MNFNYHTHTLYCDGKDTPEAFVQEAIRLNFHSLGFSSHSPLPFDNYYSIKESRLPQYKQEVLDLRKKYNDRINILLSLEMDFISGLSENFGPLKKHLGLDYIIGSVHLISGENKRGLWSIDGPSRDSYDEGILKLFNNNPQKAVTAYYYQLMSMIKTECPDIVGHLDKVKMHNHDRFFTEDEKWYRDLVLQTLQLISLKGCIVEVNTRGIYKNRTTSLFPGVPVLEQIFHLGIPVTLSSDAHKAEELSGYFNESIEILKNIGFKYLSVLKNKSWTKQHI